MNKIEFDILSVPFVEALTALGLRYEIDGTAIKVNRDSMVAEFPRAKENDSYTTTYYEIMQYVGEHYEWMKLDDDWYLLKILKYVNE